LANTVRTSSSCVRGAPLGPISGTSQGEASRAPASGHRGKNTCGAFLGKTVVTVPTVGYSHSFGVAVEARGGAPLGNIGLRRVSRRGDTTNVVRAKPWVQPCDHSARSLLGPTGVCQYVQRRLYHGHEPSHR